MHWYYGYGWPSLSNACNSQRYFCRKHLKNNYAVAGLVTLGWEDMMAYVEAAEQENCPVIWYKLDRRVGALSPLQVLGKMFNYLAENARVPVVAHLDHGHTQEECKMAVDSGFSSIMFDGSEKTLSENVR